MRTRETYYASKPIHTVKNTAVSITSQIIRLTARLTSIQMKQCQSHNLTIQLTWRDSWLFQPVLCWSVFPLMTMLCSGCQDPAVSKWHNMHIHSQLHDESATEKLTKHITFAQTCYTLSSHSYDHKPDNPRNGPSANNTNKRIAAVETLKPALFWLLKFFCIITTWN